MNMMRWLKVLLLIFFASCAKQPEQIPISPPKTLTRDQWIRLEAQTLARSLSIRDQAAQVLMTGIDGNDVFPSHLWNHFDRITPGAILLFGYNVAETPTQVHRYISSCTAAFHKMGGIIPPLFAIDHEGGTVFRLSGITTTLPSAKRVARTLTPQMAEKLYYYSGVQLRALGITMNLAPIAESLTADNAPFLASRSYGTNQEMVAPYVLAAVKGYQRAGVLPVLKHYPGNSQADPHTGVSVLDVTQESLEKEYLYSFRYAFEYGAPAVLLSHVTVPVIDPDTPFCLSHAGVTGLLRNTDSFTGLILTDDISMGALSSGGRTSVDNAVQALRAGCDMIMTSDTDIARIVAGITYEAENDSDFARRLENAVTTILIRKLESGVVASAREKYARSRLACQQTISNHPFNRDVFAEAGEQALLLLENSHE